MCELPSIFFGEAEEDNQLSAACNQIYDIAGTPANT